MVLTTLISSQLERRSMKDGITIPIEMDKNSNTDTIDSLALQQVLAFIWEKSPLKE